MVHGPGDFIGYPTDYLMCAFDDHEEARRALDELSAAGFGADHELLSFVGRAGADELDSDGTKHGIIARFERLLQHSVEDEGHLGRYEQFVRDGSWVVAVHAPDEILRERALDIFRRHGAHTINFLGKMMVETLDSAVPETTPPRPE